MEIVWFISIYLFSYANHQEMERPNSISWSVIDPAEYVYISIWDFLRGAVTERAHARIKY